jgi:hypothetical protein
MADSFLCPVVSYLEKVAISFSKKVQQKALAIGFFHQKVVN